MADYYVQFSEILPQLTAVEEGWLRQQLEMVYVFGARTYSESDLPDDLDETDADWSGYRAWQGIENLDPDDAATLGFEYAFHDDHGPPEGWGRHLWLYAEEYGEPQRVGDLVQKFLRQFRPDQSWSLTYAATCSKPRVGDFGGGAVFVTAEKIVVQDAYEFVEQHHRALAHRQPDPPNQPVPPAMSATADGARTWKCLACNSSQQVSYDWLAEHGGPICMQCDCDMRLEAMTGSSAQ
jgi:hypothetical protein